MFESLNPRNHSNAMKRLLAFFASTVLHFFLVFAVIVLPLVFFQVLPEAELLTFLIAPPPPPPPLPPPLLPPSGRSAPKQVTVKAGEFEVPATIPKGIPAAEDEPLRVSPDAISTPLNVGYIGSGPGGGITDAIGPRGISVEALPPPPPPKIRPAPMLVRTTLLSSRLLKRVEPVYPELARRARVSGTVILQVTVDEEGNVTEVRVLSGHPLLDDAAVQAVKRWKYSPTYLNGEPVPVMASVTVIFNLR